MDLSLIKNHLLDNFWYQFDHDLLTDGKSDPFIQVSLINASSVNPHRDSFGLYLNRPGKPALHTGFTTRNMSAALVLEGKYLLQKPSAAQPIDDVLGCVKGMSVSKNQIALVTVIATNLEDAKFISQSIINKIHALVGINI